MSDLSESWLSVGNWAMGVSWLSVGDWSSDLGNSWDGSLDDSWGRTVNDGVESVDWISGVGNGTDGTIGLNKRVLSLDNITITGLRGGLGVSGQTIGDGVSVAVLWVGVVWLSSNDSWKINIISETAQANT